MDRGHAHDGGVRRRRMAARTARTIGPVTATSANWKVMARAWRTTRAPILISLSCRLIKIGRSEENTSELQSLMRSSYAVFCLKTNSTNKHTYSARRRTQLNIRQSRVNG